LIADTSIVLITGAAGFIGSCMASFLNQKGFHNLILVDDFSIPMKENNHHTLQCLQRIERNQLPDFFETNPKIDFVIHFGARTDTTEMDADVHHRLNLLPSILIWEFCTKHQIPLIYASSAATYGGGENGYSDEHNQVKLLKPLNPYGESKQQFDLYALDKKTDCPPQWYGLKFFNVYGPNEYHKGRMASVILHAFEQVKSKGYVKLFRSHHPDFADGCQQRDFIYVMDILQVTWWLMHQLPENGLYNLGTGKAATFLELADAIFSSLHIKSSIEFIDTPLDIRDKYQYFTEADMSKLRHVGYDAPFISIENGVKDYIQHYLNGHQYY
jgi:ADP-L-glycero-D-manno-heptose 6-epimerase